jgi:8-oxo-dGTP pyrophosphatase MutT (NUDIX family)
MHRRQLLAILELYAARNPEESTTVARFAAFVRAHTDCFERTCVPGHVTGSAWVLSADRRCVLLTHHRKLGRWLQLGGHSDGDPDPLRVALREACEESGLRRLDPLQAAPLDLDIHEIPARGSEPPHLHHDVRYLLVAAPGQDIAISEESTDLRWVERRRLQEFTTEESQRRMERKTIRLLAEIATRRI